MEDLNSKSSTAPVSSQERRAQELEELRKKQLAKQNTLKNDASLQPITTMDSWLEMQKQQTFLSKQQEKDAKDNLASYRAIDVNNQDSIKGELKKKQMEAAEILHNYRGTKDVYFAHEVKKHSKINVSPENKNVAADVSGPVTIPTEFKSIHDIRSKFDVSHVNDNTPNGSLQNNESDGGCREIVQQLSGSSNEGSTSWIIVSDSAADYPNEHTLDDSNLQIDNRNNGGKYEEQVIEFKEETRLAEEARLAETARLEEEAQLAKTAVGFDEMKITEKLGMEEAVKMALEGIDLSDLTKKKKLPDSQSLVERLVSNTKKGHASISFGLITKRKDAATIGPYSFGKYASNSRDANFLLDKILECMIQIVQLTLKSHIANRDVRIMFDCMSVQVQNDETFKPCESKKNTLRRFVRVKIPYEVSDATMNMDIQRQIQTYLAKSIPILLKALR
jgi:hypothetical protein